MPENTTKEKGQKPYYIFSLKKKKANNKMGGGRGGEGDGKHLPSHYKWLVLSTRTDRSTHKM